MITLESSLKTKLRAGVQALGCEYHALKGPKFWPDAVIFIPGGICMPAEGKREGCRKDDRWYNQYKRIVSLRELGFPAVMWVGDRGVTLVLELVRELKEGKHGYSHLNDYVSFKIAKQQYAWDIL